MWRQIKRKIWQQSNEQWEWNGAKSLLLVNLGCEIKCSRWLIYWLKSIKSAPDQLQVRRPVGYHSLKRIFHVVVVVVIIIIVIVIVVDSRSLLFLVAALGVLSHLSHKLYSGSLCSNLKHSGVHFRTEIKSTQRYNIYKASLFMDSNSNNDNNNNSCSQSRSQPRSCSCSGSIRTTRTTRFMAIF